MNISKKLITSRELVNSDILLKGIQNLKGVEQVMAMLERIRIIAYIEAHETSCEDKNEQIIDELKAYATHELTKESKYNNQLLEKKFK